MEEEYVRYRQSTMKEKMVICKRFSRFYFNDFKPITKLEKKDIDRSKAHYWSFTSLGALLMGFASFSFRRSRYAAMEAHNAPRDLNMFGNMMNDGMMAVIGWLLGHL